MRYFSLLLLALPLCLAQAQTNTGRLKSLLPGGADKWELVWNEEFDGPDSKLEVAWKSQNSGSTHILSSRWRENAVVASGPFWLSEAIIPWAGRITDAIDGTAMEVDCVRIYREKP